MPAPEDELGTGDGPALVRLAVVARRIESAAAAATARLLAEAESVGAARGRGGRSAVELFAEQTRTSTGHASRLVKQADEMRRLPSLARQYSSGQLDPRRFDAAADQVRSISAGLTREQQLRADELAAAAAAARPMTGLKVLGEELLAQLQPESAAETLAERASRQRRSALARRALILSDDGHGTLRLSGQLPVLEGRQLQQRLDAIANSTRRWTPPGSGDVDGPATSAQRRADALLELATGPLLRQMGRAGIPQAHGPATGAEGSRQPADGRDPVPPEGEELIVARPGSRERGAGIAGSQLDGDRPTLIVTIDHETLLADLAAAKLVDVAESVTPAGPRIVASHEPVGHGDTGHGAAGQGAAGQGAADHRGTGPGHDDTGQRGADHGGTRHGGSGPGPGHDDTHQDGSDPGGPRHGGSAPGCGGSPGGTTSGRTVDERPSGRTPRSTLVGRTIDGTILSPGEMRLLACRAEILPMVLGGGSVPLDVGRAARLATTGQRRALAVRDRGCVFPGCHVPPEACDKHHIRPWEQGGQTDLSNLVLLCPHHHGEVEPDPLKEPQHNWAVELREGIATLIPPLRIDRTRTPQQHDRFRRAPTPDVPHDDGDSRATSSVLVSGPGRPRNMRFEGCVGEPGQARPSPPRGQPRAPW